jgi:hypothetical protein
MRHVWNARVLICTVLAFTVLGGALATALAQHKPKAELVEGLPDNAAIEYGTLTIDAKWSGDQTKGSATITFDTEFAEPPMVVANQYGAGGWHFFVHATATKTTANFSVMLDRSYNGKEPRKHPCQVAYVAIGKRTRP